jgi:hypothetical protein
VYEALRVPDRPSEPDPVIVYGPATAFFLDLPVFRAGEAEEVGFVAADASPWPGAIAFYRSPATSGFELNTLAELEATHGETVFDFYSGPLYRYDRSSTLRVSLTQGELASITEEALLAGGNLAAVENADGEWELLQFQTATLVSPGTYDLSVLLRGQFGSEAAMRNPVAAGAPFILLDEAVTAVDMTTTLASCSTGATVRLASRSTTLRSSPRRTLSAVSAFVPIARCMCKASAIRDQATGPSSGCGARGLAAIPGRSTRCHCRRKASFTSSRFSTGSAATCCAPLPASARKPISTPPPIRSPTSVHRSGTSPSA